MNDCSETEHRNLAALKAIERRALARPCTLAELRDLRRELEDLIIAIRRGREARRAYGAIEAEQANLRESIHLARRAIQGAIVEHENARIEINRVAKLVRSGRVEEAAMLRSQGLIGSQFSDLDLDFVEQAVKRQQSVEQQIFVAALIAAGVLLVVVSFVEILRRSLRN